jgi:hypothetical protein
VRPGLPGVLGEVARTDAQRVCAGEAAAPHIRLANVQPGSRHSTLNYAPASAASTNVRRRGSLVALGDTDKLRFFGFVVA